MNLHPSDVAKLTGNIPYQKLMNSGAGGRFLEKMANEGTELSYMLKLYPSVKYEPLDFYYVSIQLATNATEALISDLSDFYTWRGQVMSSFIVCLAPAPKFKPYIEKILVKSNAINSWIAEIALCEINNQISEKYKNQQLSLRTIRNLISPLKGHEMHPRLASQPLQSVNIESLRTAYRQGGVNAFNKAIGELFSANLSFKRDA